MDAQKTLLRIVTTGSVDDGKSTLIGRLLFETKNIFDDQLEAIRRTSEKLGRDARRPLAAARRPGRRARAEDHHRRRLPLLRDAAPPVHHRRLPGPRAVHAQHGHRRIHRRAAPSSSWTRATASSPSRAATPSSCRCCRCPHVLVVVNKMDQVGFDEAAYRRIVDDYEMFAQRLEFRDLSFLPACALDGDNVTSRSERMPWYDGPHAPAVPGVAARRRRPEPHRLPFPGAGRHPPGPRLPRLRRSDRVRHDPRRRRGRGAALRAHDAGQVDRDVRRPARGGVRAAVRRPHPDRRDRREPRAACSSVPGTCRRRARTSTPPCAGRARRPLRPGAPYLLKHTTQTVKAFVSKLVSRFDVDTLHRQDSAALGLNDLGRVEIQTTLPLFFDPYKVNRATGSFILIDPDYERHRVRRHDPRQGRAPRRRGRRGAQPEAIAQHGRPPAEHRP